MSRLTVISALVFTTAAYIACIVFAASGRNWFAVVGWICAFINNGMLFHGFLLLMDRDE